MSETATKLLEQVLQLPELEREMLASQLWESLSEAKQQQLLDDHNNDPEFQAMLEERLKEVDEHPESLLEPADVFEAVRERLRRNRQS